MASAQLSTSYTRMFVTMAMPPIAESIVDYAGSAENSTPIFGTQKIFMFTQEQYEETVMDPHNNFMKNEITLGAKWINLHRQILQLRNQCYQQELLIEEAMAQLREKANSLKTASPELNVKIQQKLKELQQQSSIVTDTLKNVNVIESQLKTLEGKTHREFPEHQHEWQEFREKYLPKLLEIQESLGISLDKHQTDYLSNQKISKILNDLEEMINRFKNNNPGLKFSIEEKLALIKNKNARLTTSDYYLFSAWHSILSTMDVTETNVVEKAETSSKNKMFASLFSDIESENKQLAAQQLQNRMLIEKEVSPMQQQLNRLNSQLNSLSTQEIVKEFNLSISQQKIADAANEWQHKQEKAEGRGYAPETPKLEI